MLDRDYATQRVVYALAALQDGAPRVDVAYRFLQRPAEPVVRSFTAADAGALHEQVVSPPAASSTSATRSPRARTASSARPARAVARSAPTRRSARWLRRAPPGERRLAGSARAARDCAPMRAVAGSGGGGAASRGAGATAREPRAEAAAKPVSGTFDVRGHGMFIECKGEGSLTVVLDSASADSTSTWGVAAGALRPRASTTARRHGLERARREAAHDRDDDRRAARGAAWKAGVEPPYVPVGASRWAG